MGGFYGSVQVRSGDREAVKAAAEKVARDTKLRMLVGPAIDGWIGIYPERSGQDQSVGIAISHGLQGDLLHLMVHDDSVFAYWFCRDGKLIDSYWSAPGYFGEGDRPEQEAMSGNPELFRPILKENVSQLPAILDRDKTPVLSFEQLERFAQLLGISNAVTSYEYLKSRETDGIKGWSQFEEVPADRAKQEREAKRRAQNRVKEERKRLRSEGLLLLEDEKMEIGPRGCTMADRFIVAWPDHRRDTAIFREYLEPWDKPQPVTPPAPADTRAIASDLAGRRIAVGGRNRVQVWDYLSGQWTFVLEVAESDPVIDVALSGDGKLLAHTSREEVVVTEIASSRRLFSHPVKGAKKAAFHASGDWLAVAGHTLGLVSLDGQPAWRNVKIVSKVIPRGGKMLARANKLKAVDLVAAETKFREIMEAEIDKMRRADGTAKTPKPTEEQIQATRRLMQIQFTLLKLHVIAAKEGRWPEAVTRPNETVQNVGFSRDGRWFWCGTHGALRVYDWVAVPRDAGADMPEPTWRFDMPVRPPGYIHAAVEEIGGTGIVFGATDGRLCLLDLLTGRTRELIKLPGEVMVTGLSMSVDGNVLGVATFSNPRQNGSGANKHKSTWQIWSYPRLRDLA